MLGMLDFPVNSHFEQQHLESTLSLPYPGGGEGINERTKRVPSAKLADARNEQPVVSQSVQNGLWISRA